jgi:O-ureido-D-serine cyclo-ligase
VTPSRANPRTIALVSARAARGLDPDEPPLAAALQTAGVRVQVVDWDDAAVDWRKFDLALLRSTWDYSQRLAQFLAWAEEAAAQTTLINPLSVIRWNTDKHYLTALARAGVPVVPSEFIEPGAQPEQAIAGFLERYDAAEIVVKPAVGAGSRDAQRHERGALTAIRAHVRRLVDAGRSALLQPYLERVGEYGETALVFFAGRFSHAIRKGPLLAPGATATTQLFAPEQISARVPDALELAVAEQALTASGTRLAYARVDLIRDAGNAPRVLELELTEPSLFFEHAARSAERFAATILALHELQDEYA